MSTKVSSALVLKAFRIADESMLSLLDCSALPLNHPKRTEFALVAAQQEPLTGWRGEPSEVVYSLEEADPAIIEALDWLIPRGLAWLVYDDEGQVAKVSLTPPAVSKKTPVRAKGKVKPVKKASGPKKPRK
jgi:hypothetical protein